jgi:hypothetical protein
MGILEDILYTLIMYLIITSVGLLLNLRSSNILTSFIF